MKRGTRSISVPDAQMVLIGASVYCKLNQLEFINTYKRLLAITLYSPFVYRSHKVRV